MKITKTDNKFEAVIGEEPRLNDMAEVSDAQAEQEEKHEALIDFLERLDSDLPGNLYEAICDMAERIEKSAEENGGKQTDWDFARPCGKVTLVISMEGDAGDVKKNRRESGSEEGFRAGTCGLENHSAGLVAKRERRLVTERPRPTGT